MAKETLSLKAEPTVKAALEREAKKKEWTLSYFLESIVKQYVKKNRLA